MKNLFYTSPKYLQKLKGLESSASEIDGLQTILNDKADSKNVYSKIEVDNKQNTFIQDTVPTIETGKQALWIDTSNGNITFNIVT